MKEEEEEPMPVDAGVKTFEYAGHARFNGDGTVSLPVEDADGR